MSLINKVLRDLDRRNASVSAPAAPSKVKPVDAKAPGHEWFWRTVAGLVLIALGWVGWVAYQIQPRPIATELAFASQPQPAKPRPTPPAQAGEAPKPPSSPQPVAVTTPAVPAAAPAAPKPEAPKAAAEKPVPPDMLRFSYSIDTPIGAPKAEKKDKPVLAARAATEAKKGRVERRDRELSGAERADVEFRRGVEFLKRGRASEAEALFASALKSDAAHRGARQALVALRLERNQLDEAADLLREGLAADPAQSDFAVTLARIYVERAQFAPALDVLNASSAAAVNHVEYHVLRGSVLQRLGRHAEAAEAYRAALAVRRGVPHAWMGLGISLEALQQRAAAADAFRNALAAGPVSGELRTFAEQRIQALR